MPQNLLGFDPNDPSNYALGPIDQPADPNAAAGGGLLSPGLLSFLSALKRSALGDPNAIQPTGPNSGGLFGADPRALGLIAGLGQAAAPSRMPVPMGLALAGAASGLLGGQNSLQDQALRQQQIRGLTTQNDLGDLTLQGYRNLGALYGTPPTAGGAVASSMTPVPAAGRGLQGLLGFGGPPSPIAAALAGNQSLPASPTSAAQGGAPLPAAAPPVAAGLSGADNTAQRLLNLRPLVQQYQIMSRTPGMQQQASSLLETIFKGLPTGYIINQNGDFQVDPNYVKGQAQVAGAEALAKVGPSVLEKQLEPYTLERPGATRIQNGQIVAQNPLPLKGVDPDTGKPYETYILPPVGGRGGSLLNPPPVPAPTPGQRGALPPAFGGLSTVPSVGGVTYDARGMPTVQTGLSPLAESSAKARGTQLEEYGQGLQTNATNAMNGQFLIDQMRRESGNGAGWVPGRFADWVGDARAILNGAGLSGPETDNALANYQAFQKNSMQLVTTATRAVSARAAVQEMQMIQSALPGAHTSAGGLSYMFDQFSANNDFLIAKNQMSDTWRASHNGTLAGFESAWNQSISPFAFLVNRMSAPDLRTMATNLSGSAQGRALLTKIMGEVATGQKLGLLGAGGAQ